MDKSGLPPNIESIPMVSDENHFYRKLEKIGNEVNMGWKILHLHLTSNLHAEGIKCDGLTSPDENKIFLELNLNSESAHETLLHEILHCILHIIGLDSEHKLVIDNESLTIRLTTGLRLFTKLNPALAQLLFTDD